MAAFNRAKIDKATPTDLEHILSLGVASDHFDKLKTTPQAWADANLGVDCTGFAIAYFDTLDSLSIDRGVYSGGVSCPWLLGIAREQKKSGTGTFSCGTSRTSARTISSCGCTRTGRNRDRPDTFRSSTTPTLRRTRSTAPNRMEAPTGPATQGRVKGAGAGQYVELDKGVVVIIHPPAFP